MSRERRGRKRGEESGPWGGLNLGRDRGLLPIAKGWREGGGSGEALRGGGAGANNTTNPVSEQRFGGEENSVSRKERGEGVR